MLCMRVGSLAPTAANAPSDPTRLWCDRTCARRDVAGAGMGTVASLFVMGGL